MALSQISPLTQERPGTGAPPTRRGARMFLTVSHQFWSPEDLTEAPDSSHRLSTMYSHVGRYIVGSILGNTVYILDSWGRP